MIPHWGLAHYGVYDCSLINPLLRCEWTQHDNAKVLSQRLYSKELSYDDNKTVTLSLYNVHSLWERLRWVHPPYCELQTNFTMTESEESSIRYNQLFDASFKNFDGISTTSPDAQVQRVYQEAYLFDLNLSHPLRNFSSLIKGSSYVASDCHRRDKANANRDNVVHNLRQNGVRIDGLGRCMKSHNNDGITLVHTGDSKYNLEMKREAIGRYLFHMAFENSIEPGYVTEKPFDALIAGTVPVYLGDKETFRSLLPHPKAAIFVEDFDNLNKLAQYLLYLETNETAYEEHREWRHTFSIHDFHMSHTLLRSSWECRICDWVFKSASSPSFEKKTRPVCSSQRDSPHHGRSVNISQYEDKAVKGSSRTVYYVTKGILRPIPDFETFLAMKLDTTKIIELKNEDMAALTIGEDLPKLSNSQSSRL